MNYLLQDMPTYELAEMEQVNILIGLLAIICGMGIVSLVVTALFRKGRRK